MTPNERLNFKNQQAIMNAVNFLLIGSSVDDTSNLQQESADIQKQIFTSYHETEKVLAPQSDEIGFEEDVSEKGDATQ